MKLVSIAQNLDRVDVSLLCALHTLGCARTIEALEHVVGKDLCRAQRRRAFSRRPNRPPRHSPRRETVVPRYQISVASLTIVVPLEWHRDPIGVGNNILPGIDLSNRACAREPRYLFAGPCRSPGQRRKGPRTLLSQRELESGSMQQWVTGAAG